MGASFLPQCSAFVHPHGGAVPLDAGKRTGSSAAQGHTPLCRDTASSYRSPLPISNKKHEFRSARANVAPRVSSHLESSQLRCRTSMTRWQGPLTTPSGSSGFPLTSPPGISGSPLTTSTGPSGPSFTTPSGSSGFPLTLHQLPRTSNTSPPGNAGPFVIRRRGDARCLGAQEDSAKSSQDPSSATPAPKQVVLRSPRKVGLASGKLPVASRKQPVASKPQRFFEIRKKYKDSAMKSYKKVGGTFPRRPALPITAVQPHVLSNTEHSDPRSLGSSPKSAQASDEGQVLQSLASTSNQDAPTAETEGPSPSNGTKSSPGSFPAVSAPPLREASRILQIQLRMFQRARSPEEALWVILRCTSLLFTTLLAAVVGAYRQVQAAGGVAGVARRVKSVDLSQVRREGVLVGRSLAGGVSGGAVRLWKGSPAPLKWPLAIFSVFWALVVLIFGAPVASDLTPLWIIGPIGTSFTIWQTQQAARAIPVLIQQTQQLALEGASQGKALLGYAKSGRLLADSTAATESVKEGILRRKDEILGLVSEKQGAIVAYVGEGHLERNSKEFLSEKGKEAKDALREWALQCWEDVSDWSNSTRRRLLKLLNKIF